MPLATCGLGTGGLVTGGLGGFFDQTVVVYLGPVNAVGTSAAVFTLTVVSIQPPVPPPGGWGYTRGAGASGGGGSLYAGLGSSTFPPAMLEWMASRPFTLTSNVAEPVLQGEQPLSDLGAQEPPGIPNPGEQIRAAVKDVLAEVKVKREKRRKAKKVVRTVLGVASAARWIWHAVK
jgi:hypothetical protein